MESIYPNIVHNSELHLTNLNPQSLYKTFFSHPWPLSNVYRPIPCLTFALNWYMGKDNVAGYHLVNITIHFLTAFFLYLTICNLYGSPKLDNRGPDNRELIAFLAASLWAVNPIQTQAVTYIVQRMASMAAMFYILGIFFYVKGRLCNVTGYRILLFLGCAVSYGLAFGSKENAAALPLSLILVEIGFFQNLEDPKTTRKIGILAAAAGVLIVLAGIIFFIHINDLSILKGYRQRSFDLPQRLMTQPGIVILYLTQLFYPMPQRLSIEHHIDIATSFFEPWYTVPAICLVLILIGLGFSQIKKRPIIACGILFFFINHLIESTVLPLELVFEHRNYLPSLFLFWPLVVGMLWLVDYYRKRRRSIAISLVAFMVLCALGLGFSTYIRNMVWATDKTLWEDAMKKAPGRTRPVYNLAKYYFSVGELETALQLFKQSLKLKGSKAKYSQALSLNGIASIYYVRRDYEKVIALCRRALEISPGFEIARYNMVLAQVKLGRWEKASESVDLLLAKQKHQAGYLFMKGFILIQQNRPERALAYLREALHIKPGDRKTLLNMGMSLSLIGQYKQAEWFLKQALDHSTRDIQAYFYLVENSLKAGDSKMLERYLDKLTESLRVDRIKSGLTGRFDELFLIHPSRELIAPVIRAKLKKIAEEISGCGPG
jgi:tetratricopeptide (TPR) repeat protein